MKHHSIVNDQAEVLRSSFFFRLPTAPGRGGSNFLALFPKANLRAIHNDASHTLHDSDKSVAWIQDPSSALPT